MTDIEKLIKRLKCPQIQSCPMDGEYPSCKVCQKDLRQEVITALSTLQAENEETQKKLNEFSEFLCHMTGGMLSKTNYTAQAMISAAEDYQQRVCDNYCDLRADLARVTAERDGAIADMEALMWFSGEGCRICAHAVEVHKEPYVRLDCNREKGTDCSPVWRGIKEN